MRVIIASIVKDEAHRYMLSALAAWSDFADTILIMDNGSEDDTRDICRGVETVVDITPPVGANISMWGKEARFRQYLFEEAWAQADEGDVIFWLDADMVPMNNPREFFEMESCDSWSFRLYDLWGQDDLDNGGDGALLYRSDQFWQGHNVSRVWAVRKRPLQVELEWTTRGIHTGHLPYNYPYRENIALMPREWNLLHYGYYTESDRMERYNRYRSVRHQLTVLEQKHASTILDHPVDMLRVEDYNEYTLYRDTDDIR